MQGTQQANQNLQSISNNEQARSIVSDPETILCIYHSNCLDGFGAAWAMRHHMPRAKIEFHAAIYNKTPVPDVTGRIVYMLDFSYPREVIEVMIATAKKFLLLDHHASAMMALRGLDDVRGANRDFARNNRAHISDGGRICFDMDRSGAGMSWDYFSNGAKRPPLIDYIEDRDLWLKKLPGCEEVNGALFSYPYDFEVWDHLMTVDPERLREEGVAIMRKQMKDTRELLLENTREMIIAGHKVPVTNLPYTMASEACHMLLKQYPDAPFTAAYMDQAHGRVFNLRSENHRQDVSEIAKNMWHQGKAGGGHRNAAGFTMPIGWEGDQ